MLCSNTCWQTVPTTLTISTFLHHHLGHLGASNSYKTCFTPSPHPNSAHKKTQFLKRTASTLIIPLTRKAEMPSNSLKVLIYPWFLENCKLSHITSPATFSSCFCGIRVFCAFYFLLMGGGGINWFCNMSVSSVMSSNYFSKGHKQPRS